MSGLSLSSLLSAVCDDDDDLVPASSSESSLSARNITHSRARARARIPSHAHSPNNSVVDRDGSIEHDNDETHSHQFGALVT